MGVVLTLSCSGPDKMSWYQTDDYFFAFLFVFSVIERLKEIMSEVEISINTLKEEQRSR